MKSYWKSNKSMKTQLFLLAVLVGISCNRNPKQTDGSVESQKAASGTKSGVMTVAFLQYREIPGTIKANGYVTFNPSKTYDVSARVSGRIDKLYIRTAWQPIRKGEKLFDIYSPEILTAETNYLTLLKNNASDSGLIEGTKNQLMLLGLIAKEIEHLKASGKPAATITIYSGYSGYNAPDLSAQGQKPEMGKTPEQAATTMKEGAYVSKGQTIIKIANTDKVWGVLKINATDVSGISLHDKIDIIVENFGESITGTIDFIEPVNNDQTVNVRVNLENTNGNIKPGSLISGTIHTGTVKGYWLPKKAVIDLGNKKIVYRMQKKTWQPKNVQTGISTGDQVQIISGLDAKDSVAADAQYLIDSDGSVKSNSDEN
jgi:membrane fusion protein, copper/silver efflux system